MDTKRETVGSKRKIGKRTEKNALTDTARVIAAEALYAVIAFLLSGVELPFGAVCLGFAFVGAVSGGHALWAAVGAIVAVPILEQPLILMGAYGVTLCLRAVFSLISMAGKRKALWEVSEALFRENAVLRAVSASVGAFTYGLYLLFEGGFLYYYLFGALISVAAAGLGAALWYGLADVRGLNFKGFFSGFFRATAALSLLGAAIYSLKSAFVWGISLSVFAAMLLCLIITEKEGVSLGVASAIVMGLAVSVSYAPLFVFGAICYSFLGALSPLLGCFATFAVGMWWGVYMEGIYALAPLAPALMAACLLFFAVNKTFFAPVKKARKGAEEKEATDSRTVAVSSVSSDEAVARLDSASRLIKELCEGLSALSKELISSEEGAEEYEEYEKRIPLDGDLCAEIGEMGVLITDELHNSNSEKKNGVKRTRKTRLSDYDTTSMAVYSSERERTEAAALELGAISDYLAGIMTVNEREFVSDGALAKKISERLGALFPDMPFRVSVFGSRQKKIIVAGDRRSAVAARKGEILREVTQICGFRMNLLEPLELGEETYLTMVRRPVLKASASWRCLGAEGENGWCGDCADFVSEKNDGRLYAFISDGMGSGREAALMSRMCVSFLKRLLPVGGAECDTVNKTLNMLNSFLRYRNNTSGSECAATVDLGVLDLIDCKVSFYKSGAAPTYIFRDGSLFKLRLRTVPVGIVKEPDIGRVSMELLPKDIIIMLSDGLTQGREECPELFDFLRSRLITYSADGLADAVAEYAKTMGRADDVSVMVIKIDDSI